MIQFYASGSIRIDGMEKDLQSSFEKICIFQAIATRFRLDIGYYHDTLCRYL